MAERDREYGKAKPAVTIRLTAEQVSAVDELRRTIPNADGGRGISRSEFGRMAVMGMVSASTGVDWDATLSSTT